MITVLNILSTVLIIILLLTVTVDITLTLTDENKYLSIGFIFIALNIDLSRPKKRKRASFLKRIKNIPYLIRSARFLLRRGRLELFGKKIDSVRKYSFHIRSFYLFISPLIFLYYKVKAKILRRIKNV